MTAPATGVEEALRALGDGEPERALACATAAAGEDPLAGALAAHLGDLAADPYREPTAFAAFIDHGDNPALYRQVTAAVADSHAALAPARVLDVGCGDGRVTAATLTGATATVDLVEPSADLLARAEAALAGTDVEVRPHPQGVVDFLQEGEDDVRWDLVQSTFALHTLDPADRTRILAALAARTDHLLVAEFDVPALPERSPAHLAHLADRYRRGLATYRDHPEVVTGFLLPVLVGQLDPARPRLTHEETKEAWAEELVDAGWAVVTIRSLFAHWWAPAVLLHASR